HPRIEAENRHGPASVVGLGSDDPVTTHDQGRALGQLARERRQIGRVLWQLAEEASHGLWCNVDRRGRPEWQYVVRKSGQDRWAARTAGDDQSATGGEPSAH